MDEQTIKEVADLQAEIERLNAELRLRNTELEKLDEQLNAMRGYLIQKRIEPDFLPA